MATTSGWAWFAPNVSRADTRVTDQPLSRKELPAIRLTMPWSRSRCFSLIGAVMGTLHGYRSH
ncbi:hypothetical protein THSYN_05780 [Candidatus Thiodictyon syntrophicum]|uniref:Uncharacterized protein n=1 Tax=Candidatus Thiodictyon syntrophicum TaxID=1166950 RepID=A0A2K8U4P3_9GAMM|nr:hypothetical protein THSYN_05780 [Candidatus Thiodictyon syntrophicum]